jgi:hypothetical protein
MNDRPGHQRVTNSIDRNDPGRFQLLRSHHQRLVQLIASRAGAHDHERTARQVPLLARKQIGDHNLPQLEADNPRKGV